MLCPNCGEGMLPLFSTLYCKYAPDGRSSCGPDRKIVIRDRTWRMRRVGMPASTPIPMWATHAWNLNGSTEIENPRCSDEQLGELFQKHWEAQPGWPIEDHHRARWAAGERRCEIVIFAEVSRA